MQALIVQGIGRLEKIKWERFLKVLHCWINHVFYFVSITNFILKNYQILHLNVHCGLYFNSKLQNRHFLTVLSSFLVIMLFLYVISYVNKIFKNRCFKLMAASSFITYFHSFVEHVGILFGFLTPWINKMKWEN